MEQWEYFAEHIKADMRDVAGAPDIPPGDHPRYSPLATIPRLNAFGAEGWELVAMHPVHVGSNDDVRYPTGSSHEWARDYFCTFKRRKFIATDL